MKVYPLKSLTIAEASEKQFKLIDAITQEFDGLEMLSRGDLGVNPINNIPITTFKVEKVIARFFSQESAVFVRGSGTASIREALSSILKSGDLILVHDAPIYSTTETTLAQLGLNMLVVDFNDEAAVKDLIENRSDIKCVLIQYTRQKLDDSYDMASLISLIKSIKDIPIITDDNYAVMKVDKIGAELGADLSCFSTFKLLGPEGIGCVVGKKDYIDKIRKFHYSGGSQTQGHEAMDVLRGLTFAPVTYAIQAVESEKIVAKLKDGQFKHVKDAVIVNAQSKVILVNFDLPIAKEVLQECQKLGGAPYPIGAESKYEIVPMFYRVSGTMIHSLKDAQTHWIRINPMRSGAETVLNILSKAIERVV